MNQQYLNLITNVFSLSLQQLLHKYEVYPQECFQQRSAVGLNLWSVKQSILSEYIDKLVEQVTVMLAILEGIEIQIKEGNQVLLTYSITISFKHEANIQFCQFDSDIQLKALMYSLLQQLKKFKINDNAKTFNVQFLTNGGEGKDQKISEQILQNWIPVQESEARQTNLVNSLHMPNLDLLIAMIL